jgi:hypothetical protein
MAPHQVQALASQTVTAMMSCLLVPAGAAGRLLIGSSLNAGVVTALAFVSNAATAWTQVIADSVVVKLSQGQDMVRTPFTGAEHGDHT